MLAKQSATDYTFVYVKSTCFDYFFLFWLVMSLLLIFTFIWEWKDIIFIICRLCFLPTLILKYFLEREWKLWIQIENKNFLWIILNHSFSRNIVICLYCMCNLHFLLFIFQTLFFFLNGCINSSNSSKYSKTLFFKFFLCFLIYICFFIGQLCFGYLGFLCFLYVVVLSSLIFKNGRLVTLVIFLCCIYCCPFLY